MGVHIQVCVCKGSYLPSIFNVKVDSVVGCGLNLVLGYGNSLSQHLTHCKNIHTRKVRSCREFKVTEETKMMMEVQRRREETEKKKKWKDKK